jgi:hypothetical protein
VPASCSPHLDNNTKTVRADTPFSNYPQLYYVLVGVPSLVLTGAHAVYAMRFASVVISAGLIALGLFLLGRYHPRRLPLAASLVALTPMVLFLSGVVDSSGMEITAGFAAWCGGLCVVETETVPRALAIWTSLSFAVFILSRPLSPASAAVIVVVLATLAGWRRTRALLR